VTITYHQDLIQGTDEWHQARLGLLTASEMKLIITPTLKMASNEKERSHLYELLAQRITGYVEPSYVSDDMLRGRDDEIDAVALYNKTVAKSVACGFVTNDQFGFTLGYSPDALVGDDGQIECKSRRQKYQAQTLVEGEVPDEYMIQLQTGLIVTARKWVDFISYCGGMPMFTKRVYPDDKIQDAILLAATEFETRLQVALKKYTTAIVGLPATERRVYEDILV
jgi:predicted phage-related endonuclease